MDVLHCRAEPERDRQPAWHVEAGGTAADRRRERRRIVSIGLHHPVANCLDYALLLQEKYRLIECNIVPAFSEESTLDSVSFGCYQLMARYLQDDKEKIIGLGSGLTLKKALQRIDFDSQNTRCVALISAMDADGQCNYYDDVPLLLTSKIKAKYYQWPAPRYAQTQEEYDMWCTSRLFPQRLRRRPPGGRYFCRHWAIRHPKPYF